MKEGGEWILMMSKKLLPPFERRKQDELRNLVRSIFVFDIDSDCYWRIQWDKKEVTAQTRPLNGY